MEELIKRLPELKATLLEHLVVLTLLPVTLAVLIAVPLAVAVRNRPLPRSAAVGVSSVVQTIPSLAMLAFLLPLFGIGRVPAVIALTLYATLPILQNTLAALRGVPPEVVEAAEGMGFSPWQKLALVELPLAAPVIVSGLRTATVICVGVATLSTFIGAGGLGDFINRGLALNRMSLLLIGAGTAAALALALDFVLDTVGAALHPGRKPRSLAARSIASVALVAGIAGFMALPGAGKDDDAAGPATGVIHIGSKNFTEQIILGELLARWIEHRTGLRAVRHLNLGGTVICHEALVGGEIDVYVEYSGTALMTLLGKDRDPRATPEQLLAEVRREYAERFDCLVLPPLGFENTYAVAVRRAMAEEYGWQTVSDLADHDGALRGGFTAEFMEREDGLPGVVRAYGLTFAKINDLGPELMYPAVAQGEVDIIGAFSTDGRILEFGLALLEDNRRFFPPYQAAAILRRDTAERFPQLERALRELEGRLDNETMTRLNHSVDVGKRDPRDVVREFVEALSSKLQQSEKPPEPTP